MKKIINGKRYNTETAEPVGYTKYGNPGSLNYWEEVLYRKKTGEFFLHGCGGAMSRYARKINEKQWAGGEKIKPLELKYAKRWVEIHLDADKYEEIFGEIHESKCQISTWIPLCLKDKADDLKEKGYTLADIFAVGVKTLHQQLIFDVINNM